MFAKIKKSFQLLNYRLLITIFITLLLPTLYQSLRMHFIGSMPNTSSYSMAANIQWVNVLFEVLDEAFLLPLFFILHKIIKSNYKIIGQVYFIAFIYLFFVILFISLAHVLLKTMTAYNNNIKTLDYIRLEIANKFFLLIINITIVLLIIINQKKALIGLFILQTLCNIFCDLFLLSQFACSFKLGVIGVAYGDLITSFVLVFFACFILKKYFHFCWTDLVNPIWNIKFYANSQIISSGLESFVRNTFYVVFVLNIIAHMQNPHLQGVWWATSSFMYSWLLMPIFVLSKYINNQMKQYQTNDFWEKFGSVFLLMMMVFLLWVILMPLYQPFVRYFLNIAHYKIVTHLIYLSLGFYCFFALCEIIDKTFYGEGKAHYVLLQSIVANAVVYLPFYFAQQHYSIQMITIIYGVGMLVDSVLTMSIFAIRHWVEFVQKNKLSRCSKNKLTQQKLLLLDS